MMYPENRTFVRQERTELLAIIKEFNERIGNTDYAFDTDRNTLRRLRNKLIETVDEINHLEYKELI